MTEHDGSLLAAICARNNAQVEHLLQQGANPNTRDAESGLTALMMAAGRGEEKMCAHLLAVGADVFTKDNQAGASALHKACQGGSLNVVRQLLAAGAFVDDIVVSTGHTALIEAIWFKYPDIVNYLLEQGAGININTHYGFTLLAHLEYALKVNHIDVDKLQQAAVDVHTRQQNDNKKVTQQHLMQAVIDGDLAAVKMCIKQGADLEERYPILNGFNDDHTPLLVACRDGHEQIVIELLQAGADVNVTEPTFGAVPLHKATYNGHTHITQLLTEQPDININYQGPSNGYTPLHDALWHGFDECSRILIEANSRLDLQGHDGKTPLNIANEAFGPEHELTLLIKSKT